MGLKKAYTFRLDPALLKKLETFEGSRTSNVEAAIQKYVDSAIQSAYDSNMVEFLQGQVTYLQKMNSYLSLPFYKKWITEVPLLENKK